MSKEKKKEVYSDASYELHEFIPFACHRSERTLVTKNSELVQVIKIPNTGTLDDSQFRKKLIDSINENIDPSRFAVWVHNIRTKQKLESIKSSDIVEHVDYQWKASLPSSLKYKNCIYISLIRDATKINHWIPRNYLRSLVLKQEAKLREKHFTQNEQELDELAEKFLSDFETFGATRLECKEDESGNYHSEALEFMYQILTLDKSKIGLTLNDSSRDISPDQLLFNHYTGTFSFFANNKKFYGSVLAVKETHQLPAFALQDLLNIDSEMVITHAIDFAHGTRYLSDIKKQEHYAFLSKDRELHKIYGFEKEHLVTPALEQVHVTLINESPQLLQKAVAELAENLADLGIISTKEDIRSDGTYWASLPANFVFLRRQDSTPKNQIASLACFGDDKYKSVDDCFFGSPLTFFEDQEGEPHPLHFYRDGQSNTLIISTNPEQQRMVANLLAAQATKIGSNIIYYDKAGENEGFAKSIGASYMNTLDMDKIKTSLSGDKTIIVLSSLEQILQNDGHEFFANFIDIVNDNNAIVIACVNYTDNCEALLPNFRTQIFFGGEIDPYSDHFDIFDDEIDIITFLGDENLYLKQGYNELVVKFNPTDQLKKTLLMGSI